MIPAPAEAVKNTKIAAAHKSGAVKYFTEGSDSYGATG